MIGRVRGVLGCGFSGTFSMLMVVWSVNCGNLLTKLGPLGSKIVGVETFAPAQKERSYFDIIGILI